MGERVGCVAEAGSTFTVAGTIDNVIHFWGTRNISPVTRPNTQVILLTTSTFGQNDEKPDQLMFEDYDDENHEDQPNLKSKNPT